MGNVVAAAKAERSGYRSHESCNANSRPLTDHHPFSAYVSHRTVTVSPVE